MKAGVPNWDVVEVEAEELALGCADGIYKRSTGKNSAARTHTSRQQSAIAASATSSGRPADCDELKDAPKTWADFWDTKKFPGKRGLRKGFEYALEFALMADGVPVDKVCEVLSVEGGVDRAFKKLDELKADIIWWDAGAQPLQLLSSGQVVMTSAYDGRISGINRTEGKKFGFVFPGSVYAIDSWVIP
ncbi:extracellular solute-binding protein [Rhizobium etli]|uniref:extracellular solute-binding protein n=1 Tax=Rhizobium etli TaxID=29449 RepID=UPI000AFC04A5